MTPNEQRELLKTFVNHLEDHPLEPNDAFYYDFLEHSDDDPIAELAARISFAQSQSVNLFTGQSGSGKSTELRRLRKKLRDDGCVVFLLDMRDYMNLTTPVEISDFLISIMSALSEAVEDEFDKGLHKSSYIERLIKFLNTEVRINELDMQGIKASLKDDPSFKQRLQQGLKGHVARIVRDAHEFAQEVVTFIREKTRDEHKKVVLLIDSVEQLRGVGADGAEEVYKSAINLFSGHANSLQMPMLHIVYTIPPYLIPLVPALGRQLGSNLSCTLPSIHVQKRKYVPNVTVIGEEDDTDGLEIMRELLNKRCVQWQEVFNQAQIERLAKASGGDLRDFFRLIRDSLIKASIKGGCPVQDTVLEQTLNHARREMLPIAQKDKEWLIKINDSKDAKLENIEQLPILARFFDTKLVLNYRNGDDWYDVHPLLRGEIRS